MDKEPTIRYSNNELSVLWKPHLCIHSKKCWQGLGEVFKPLEKPWVKIDGAPAEKVREQVRKCPSGALGFEDQG
jgi:uncharacterized Fe-S cluster protein YjdI